MKTTEIGEISYLLQKIRIVLGVWKTVLAGSLVLFGLGAGGVFILDKPTYKSRMVIPLNARMLGLLKTDVVLDPVIKGAHLAIASSNMEAARRSLAERIVVSRELGPGSGLYSVSFSDSSREGAQRILEQCLAQLLILSKPTGSSRAAMMQELDTLKNTLAHLKELTKKLGENAASVKAGDEGEMYARAFVHLVSAIEAKEAKVRELQASLEGMRVEDVVLAPTPAATSDPHDYVRRLAGLGFASLLIMSLFVVLRDQWGRYRSERDSPAA